MGAPDGNKPAWSIELCGGTHVRRTGDIGAISRSSPKVRSGAGIRRIEAVTGAAAEAVIAANDRTLREVRCHPAYRAGGSA